MYYKAYDIIFVHEDCNAYTWKYQILPFSPTFLTCSWSGLSQPSLVRQKTWSSASSSSGLLHNMAVTPAGLSQMTLQSQLALKWLLKHQIKNTITFLIKWNAWLCRRLSTTNKPVPTWAPWADVTESLRGDSRWLCWCPPWWPADDRGWTHRHWSAESGHLSAGR